MSYTQAGGETETQGSGHDIEVPVEAAAKVKEIPVEVLGQAMTVVSDDSTQVTGEDGDKAVQGIELPKGVDSLMKANEVPNLLPMTGQLPVNTLPNVQELTTKLPTPAVPALAEEQSFVGELPLIGGGLLALVPDVQGVTGERSLPAPPVTTPALPTLPVATPALPVIPPLVPLASTRAVPAPALPDLPADVPALSGLDTGKAFSLITGVL